MGHAAKLGHLSYNAIGRKLNYRFLQAHCLPKINLNSCRSDSEFALEGCGEMRRITEADFGRNIHYSSSACFHKLVGLVKTLLYQPFLRRKVADFLEIALKCGKASSPINSPPSSAKTSDRKAKVSD